MTPTARNVALAAAATILPAAAAALTYSERTRRIGHSIGDRVYGLFDESPGYYRSRGRRMGHASGDRARSLLHDGSSEIEASTRRISQRLDDLAHRLDSYTMSTPAPQRPSPIAMIGGGIAAALLIPTVLTAIFAPHKLREARDAVTGYFASEEEIEEELTRVSERLESLSANLDKQRSSNFDDVVAAAKRDD